jgi:hypothetical protein
LLGTQGKRGIICPEGLALKLPNCENAEDLMAKELESVVLTTDLPEYGLTQGDIGTIVLVHGDGKGYEVEFMTLDGETVAIISLLPSQVRPIGRREIAHARPVTTV